MAPGNDAVVAEFVQRAYSRFDKRRVQAYCEKHKLTAPQLKRELCRVIYLRLDDAAFGLEPQQNEDALVQLQEAATALYELVKTEMRP